MELGEKIRQARLDAGLTQRALCADTITRNMLSQIEHGTARPSMDTLRFLASRLGRPMSYFLEEGSSVSHNQHCMEAAWRAYESADSAGADALLREYAAPDPLYDREYSLLRCMVTLQQAELAQKQSKTVYARELLARSEAELTFVPWLPELRSRHAKLLAALAEPIPTEYLPNVDAELLLLAYDALMQKNPRNASRILDAVQEERSARWYLLRGRAAMMQGSYKAAAEYLASAEAAYPSQVIPALEECYRELGDYRMAYLYAKKERE